MPYLWKEALVEHRTAIWQLLQRLDLEKVASRPSPICWGFGHLEVAEMEEKWLMLLHVRDLQSSHLPLKYRWKVIVFSQIRPSSYFLGSMKWSVCPWFSLLVCMHEHSRYLSAHYQFPCMWVFGVLFWSTHSWALTKDHVVVCLFVCL